MSKRRNLRNRIEALEAAGNVRDVVLVFHSGGSRAVKINIPLGILCAAMAKISAQIGPPEGRIADAPRAIPTSLYDQTIAELGIASDIITNDDLIRRAFEASREACNG